MTVQPIPQVIPDTGSRGECGHHNVVRVHSAVLGTDGPVVVEADVFGPAGLKDLHPALDERSRQRDQEFSWMYLGLIGEAHGTHGLERDGDVGGERRREPRVHRGLGFGAQRGDTAGICTVDVGIAGIDGIVDL